MSMNNHDRVIDIVGLSKSFTEGRVLTNIHLHLLENENLVILGRSGTGKSVLIKCIVGLEKFDRGNIFIFGNDVAAMNETELNNVRRKIGFLFQGGALYDSMTIEENLLFPLDRNTPGMSHHEKMAIVDEALESVGLIEARKKMPNELSGGMKKRAGLARTLVLKPEVILYDEPTTGLDPFTSQGISELIVSVRERYKTSSIVVTHDMKSAKIIADRMIIMEKGEILAEGTYNELKKYDNEVIRGFFN